MKKLVVVCEGETEREFVMKVLAPALLPRMTETERAFRCIDWVFPGGKPHVRGTGGDVRYARVRPTVLATLRSSPHIFCTTLVDYYALGADFPRKPASSPIRTMSEKARLIEEAVLADVAGDVSGSFGYRFRPYLSMHEFEGLLFSDPERMAKGMNRPDLAPRFREIRDSFNSPEWINDSRLTAPSKRIEALIADYDKVLSGTNAALAVGLETMQRECEHFRQWFDWLRTLPLGQA